MAMKFIGSFLLNIILIVVVLLLSILFVAPLVGYIIAISIGVFRSYTPIVPILWGLGAVITQLAIIKTVHDDACGRI